MERTRTTYKKPTKTDGKRLFIELPTQYIIKNQITKEDYFRITKINEVPRKWKKKQKTT